VTIVAVFLAYNANQGLPFVPTYDLDVSLPNAANLVAGNDVREGGFRIGVIDKIKPVKRADGSTFAVVHVKLQKSVEPLPIDSTVIVRSRSALGLKYLEISPGTASGGFQAGSTVPLALAQPHPVEIDEVLNTFDLRTRQGIKGSFTGFGTGLTGRGKRPEPGDPEPAAAVQQPPTGRAEPLLRADTARAVLPLARSAPPASSSPWQVSRPPCS